MDILLKNGASVNDKDGYGGTALHRAAYSNNLEAIQFLLEHGASVNMRDNFNETPVDKAQKRNN